MSDGASVFASALGGFDQSLFAKFASLVILPFAHEDLAIVLGGYIVVHKLMPVGLVLLGIYGGMVASDFALYGIGVGARRLPWLNRLAVDDRVHAFSSVLKRNLFGIVALCRVVPGLVFVAFIACGWTRVSLWRFTAASLLVSAVYLPLMLYLVVAFGDVLTAELGLWTWPLLLAALVGTGVIRRRVFAFGRRTAGAALNVPASEAHRGMPALAGLARKVARAERIPPILFYLPLVGTWIWLGLRYRSLTLPSAANPNVPAGGMWGESKSDCLIDVAAAERQWIADFVVVKRSGGIRALYCDLDRARSSLAAAGLNFPLVAKPDIGWHGYGVRRLDSVQDLRDYLARFPDGARLMLQRFVPYAAEAAVLYARIPGQTRGRVLSLAFRYCPHVVGDGRSTVRDLVLSDPRARWKGRLHLGHDPTHAGLTPGELARVPAAGEVVRIAMICNQRAGALYRDARRFITPALEARFDDICRGMSEFHYGRFDVRFESASALARGEGFSIVEINGIGGEAIDVWDPNLPVREVYRRLVDQQRILFMIGDKNRARGFAPTPLAEFLRLLVEQTRLIAKYPASG